MFNPKPHITRNAFRSLLLPIKPDATMSDAPLVSVPYERPLFGIKGVMVQPFGVHVILQSEEQPQDPREGLLKGFDARFEEFRERLFEGEMDLQKWLMFATRGDETALYHAKRMLNGDGPDSDEKRLWQVLESAMKDQGRGRQPLPVFLFCSDGISYTYARVPSLLNEQGVPASREEFEEGFHVGLHNDYKAWVGNPQSFFVLRPEA